MQIVLVKMHVINGNTQQLRESTLVSRLYLHTIVLSVEDLYFWDTEEVGGATLAAPVAVVGGVGSKSSVALSPAVLVVLVSDR